MCFYRHTVTLIDYCTPTFTKNKTSILKESPKFCILF